jgi:putative membrane protein
MDRRNALTLLAIAIAAPTTARAAGEAPISDAEKEHAMHTLAVGSVSLETARVAEQKAENSWVKKFAQYEVAEQTTIAEILKSTGATAAKLTDKQLEMIQKIKDAKAGARFDEEFLADQLAGHLEKGKDEAAINLSKLARAQIKEHIDLIETIRKDLKA